MPEEGIEVTPIVSERRPRSEMANVETLGQITLLTSPRSYHLNINLTDVYVNPRGFSTVCVARLKRR